MQHDFRPSAFLDVVQFDDFGLVVFLEYAGAQVSILVDVCGFDVFEEFAGVQVSGSWCWQMRT